MVFAAFIGGVLVGAFIMRWAVLASVRRAVRREESDEAYASVRTAALRHINVNGTLNIPQFRRLTDASYPIAIRWLDRMVDENVVRVHSHGKGVFYTRP
ncbi:MAG TPA: hypothetical protein VMU12_01930 [Candidatus Paceibacterota bacterium]|nr:hypothetical protein [Candidatus Paceibacterota bacterium]